MKKPLDQTWNLDNFFPGGSSSPEFSAHLQALVTDLTSFQKQVDETQTPSTLDEAKAWSKLLDTMQELAKRLREGSAFISCLTAQNVHDENAKLLSGRIKQIAASYASILTKLDDQILHMPEAVWQELLVQDEMQAISYPLNERRQRAKEKLSPEQESLAGDLAVNGYHGWSDLYNTIVGRMTLPYEVDGELKSLSMGQAQNMMSHGDRNIRADVFEKWEEVWGNEAELFANALNNLAGFRINLYNHRGWDTILKEPLEINRMSEETLNAMWGTIERNKDIFVAFLERKAKLLGLEKLSWFDVFAPLSSTSKKVSYDEAADFIVEHFHRFSPKLADFTVKNFEERWIEAEDRAGKRPGGFCTSFPVSQESRIFMTFSGTPSNVSTLAHELGHAYHQHVMNDLPQMAQGYAMNVAETASTFAEMIVADAAVKNAATEEEKIALLEDKVGRSIAFFMDIHARFLFETSFYEKRKEGPLSVGAINELMENAQKTAFHNALDTYHPHFWASKLHFYITGVPFYNFPYTFGYLFSAGVYARALEEGAEFEDKYIALLRDTGSMRVEDLAAKHLGVDLTKDDFWQSAVDLAIADVKEFLSLTE